jgi:hypothetical protein
MYHLLSFLFIAHPFLMVYMKYGNVDSESMWRWLVEQPLSHIIKVHASILFGILLFTYGNYRMFAIW